MFTTLLSVSQMCLVKSMKLSLIVCCTVLITYSTCLDLASSWLESTLKAYLPANLSRAGDISCLFYLNITSGCSCFAIAFRNIYKETFYFCIFSNLYNSALLALTIFSFIEESIMGNCLLIWVVAILKFLNIKIVISNFIWNALPLITFQWEI